MIKHSTLRFSQVWFLTYKKKKLKKKQKQNKKQKKKTKTKQKKSNLIFIEIGLTNCNLVLCYID